MKHGPNFKDLTGKIFDRLTVIKFNHVTKNGKLAWFVKCICGNNRVVLAPNLNRGKTKSCGCLRQELTKRRRTIHGMTNTRFYKIWEGMKERCLNPKHKYYSNYGGRGIRVCNNWMNFINFMEDMHESYLEHVEEFGTKDTTLDRLNSDTGYKFSNCKWSTREEQNRNTRTSTLTKNFPLHNRWKNRLRCLLGNFLRNNLKKSQTLELYLGCSLSEFKKHIESFFQPGMTWSNHGRGFGKWELDHIVGCNNFDLSKEENRKKCFNYKNLKPMWYEDHLKKVKIRSEE